jgi:hypothetical protein
VRVPHTLVSLSPPPGFTETRAFRGFENRRDGWMIRVEDLGVSAEVVAAFSSPESANRMFGPDGVRITRIEQLALDSGDVPLAIGVQKAFFGRELVKYMALMGGGGARPVVIMFNLSRSSTLGRSDVEAVLRSVKIDDPPTLAESVAQLPFGFREVPPFHTTLAGAGLVWLAAFDDLDRSAWLTIVIDRIPPDPDRDTRRPAETAQTMNAILMPNRFSVGIVEQRAEAFAGGPGDFIMASADGRTVFQFLRVLPDQTWVRFSAEGESRAIEDAREAIMEIAMSVELRE